MDLTASAATAVEGNLPISPKLSRIFHYVCPLLAVVEINVVFFSPVSKDPLDVTSFPKNNK